MPKLDVDRSALATFCARHHVKRLSLFGSTLEGRDHPDSDIDLLVEFEPGFEPGLLALAGMQEELSTMMGGQTVDLRTPNEISRYFRDDVMRRAQVQFAR